jgi:transcriptional regulator GlxA family with amidase domain
MELTYGLFIYKNAANLDFVGPHDVFFVSCFLQGNGRVVTVAEKSGPIKCAGGLEILPGYTIETAPKLDVLVVPGAQAEDLSGISDAAISWIGGQAEKTRFTASVCTGALVLQRAGLLAGRKATTHWMLVEELAKDPTTRVLPEMRYVRDGAIVTSQGVSAGIDMALWLIGQLHEPEHARQVRKFIQYDPAPPYTAEV